MDWRERVDALCYEGETVEERFDFDGAALVVTSHRVLAFTPDSGGPAFRATDRPNVAGVGTATAGSWRALRWAVLLTGAGVALLAVAATVSFAAPIESALDGADTSAAPGAMGTVETVVGVLALLDALVLWSGLLACVLAVGLFGYYLRSRTPTLVVSVAADPDLELPVPASEATVAAVEAAIRAPTDGDADPVRQDKMSSPSAEVVGPYPDPSRGRVGRGGDRRGGETGRQS